MNIIETQNLTKTYGDFTAVSHLNLHIRKGSVYGFLGPNGAGKSTTMKMFLGLTQPTEGSFHIDGKTYPSDRVPILKEVGSFIEAPAFYGNLSGEENLEIIRKILGLPKSSVDDALELVGLTEFRKRLAKKYSLGMKQRLGLAGALIGRPPILILDEPTNGLDPVGIHEIRTLIRSLPQKYDCTVLVEPLYVCKNVCSIYAAAIPMAAVYLAVSTLIQSPIFSVGIGLASIVPSVLMINTKIWFAYPMSYPFYLIMVAYGRAAEGVYETQIAWLPWLPVAVGITILALVVSCMRYGASERR